MTTKEFRIFSLLLLAFFGIMSMTGCGDNVPELSAEYKILYNSKTIRISQMDFGPDTCYVLASIYTGPPNISCVKK
jgi:hypothetical protein